MRILRYLILGLSLVTATAWSQGYPDKSRPIRIIVPSGAASSSDLLARAYGKAMAEVAGLNVIVENKPGAETVLGVQALLAAPPDGYTMMLSSSSTQTLNVVMIPNLPYDPFRDFAPLVGVGTVATVMSLGPSTPAKTAREFIAAARANPGKLTCASATANARLSCELLQSLARIKLLNVPYKTTAAAVTAVAAGEADMVFADPSSSAAQWQTGRLRPVAGSGARRIPGLPNVPPLREEGVAEYDVTAWFATYFPAKTPPEVVATMRDILQKANKTKLMADTLAGFSMEPLNLVGDQLTALNRREVDMWAKVVKAANLKPN
ncbi:MAG TPA: tripartite tricarboxylate transporter substrate binding protein [Ramlibacter sp.]|nr:tripartite tricarboxylate transporter substrate binding protein [Ramlibacter sp.]